MAKKRSLFSVQIDFTDEDLNQLFEPFDPLIEDGLDDIGYESQEAFDPIDFEYLNSIKNHFLSPIVDNYFRAELYGAEKLQKVGPVILGCNHSGTAFPYDAIVFDALLWRYYGFSEQYKCRSVYSPKLAQVWWMRPFGIDNFWRRGGAVDMTFKNFSALLKAGERVLYYPEGVPGIGKGFNRRYQLQHFYSSFVILAAIHDAPFYPIMSVNSEWVNPTSITIKWVDKLFDKALGIPFFPVPAILIGLIFPFFYYLSFPCKMKFFIGDPVNIRELLKQNGIDHYTQAEKKDFQKIADQIQSKMQSELTQLVELHGKKPYEIKEFFKKMKILGWSFWKSTPLGWPISFLGHSRNISRKKAGKLGSMIRDWDILFFYVPFGWLFIALARALRKPPYGYRGLSRKEWRKKTGSYYWSLEKNPIPTRKERFGEE